MANNLKNNFLLLLIGFSLFGNEFCEDNCPKIRLIQPLDSSGLSYVVFAGGQYYMISNSHLKDTTEPLQPFTIPDQKNISFNEDDRLTGVLVYVNSACNPPMNHLVVYTFVVDSKQSWVAWHTTHDLAHWSPKQTWTSPKKVLPETIRNNLKLTQFMERISFTMFWHKTKRLYLIILPQSGTTANYFTITRVSDSCGEDSSVKGDKSFTEILDPFGDNDCCFIHNDQQIICYGRDGFSSYDIDLNQTNDEKLRVKNKATAVQRIPVMDIIERIAANITCKVITSPPTSPPTRPTTSTAASPSTSPTTSPITSLSTTTSETKSGFSMFWVIIVVILLVVIGLIFVIWIFVRNQTKSDEEIKPPKERLKKGSTKKREPADQRELDLNRSRI